MNTILKDERITIDLTKNNNLRKIFFSYYGSCIENVIRHKKISVNKVGDLSFLKGLSSLLHVPSDIYFYQDIYHKYRREINDVSNGNIIACKNKIEQCTYLFLTEILYIELLAIKVKNNENYQLTLKKVKKLINNDFIFKNFTANKHDDVNNKNRSHLFENNKNSIVWSRDNKKFISFTINSVLNEINPVLIEFPNNYDRDNLLTALTHIASILRTFDINNRDFVLRFKKLGTYSKKGMFIKPSNMIILDARNVNLFQNELGHFIFENGIKFCYQGKVVDKKGMIKIVNKEKKNKPNLEHELSKVMKDFEGYKVDSEIFSNWFENLIVNNDS